MGPRLWPSPKSTGQRGWDRPIRRAIVPTPSVFVSRITRARAQLLTGECCHHWRERLDVVTTDDHVRQPELLASGNQRFDQLVRRADQRKRRVVDECCIHPHAFCEFLSRRLAVAGDIHQEGANVELDVVEARPGFFAHDGKAAREKLAKGMGVDAALIHDSPFALIGPPNELIETLIARRDQFGLSYVIVGGDDVESFAPVVAALAGKELGSRASDARYANLRRGHDCAANRSIPSALPRRLGAWPQARPHLHHAVVRVVVAKQVEKRHRIKRVGDANVAPRDVLAAVLPNPAKLGHLMHGRTCAGTWVKGMSYGEPREVYLYHVADNETTMREYGAQAVLWQTAICPVVALELLATGAWKGVGVRGADAFDAVPFLNLLGDYNTHHGMVEMGPRLWPSPKSTGQRGWDRPIRRAIVPTP
ncbi:MAG: hypothetical protein ACKOJH_04420 [Actinomycetota bacterium]